MGVGGGVLLPHPPWPVMGTDTCVMFPYELSSIDCADGPVTVTTRSTRARRTPRVQVRGRMRDAQVVDALSFGCASLISPAIVAKPLDS